MGNNNSDNDNNKKRKYDDNNNNNNDNDRNLKEQFKEQDIENTSKVQLFNEINKEIIDDGYTHLLFYYADGMYDLFDYLKVHSLNYYKDNQLFKIISIKEMNRILKRDIEGVKLNIINREFNVFMGILPPTIKRDDKQFM